MLDQGKSYLFRIIHEQKIDWFN